MDLYSPFAGLPPPPQDESTAAAGNGVCQKEDWQFHKRRCEKPKPKEAPRPTAPAAAPAAASSSAPASSSSPAPAASSSNNSGKPSSSSTEVVRDEDLDDEERAALEAVRKTGYRVHWRKAEDEAAIRAAIGDVAPKRIDVAPTGAAAVAFAPTPLPVAAAPTSGASAWNAAGTSETINKLPLVKERLAAALREGREGSGPLAPLDLPGIGKLRVSSAVSSWGDSSADILLARGNKKTPYDLSFKVTVSLLLTAGGGAAAAAAASTSSEGDATAAAEKPHVTLHFVDVSDSSEGAPREVRIEALNVSDAHRGAVLDALRPDGKGAAGGLLAGIRDIVERVVCDFKQM